MASASLAEEGGGDPKGGENKSEFDEFFDKYKHPDLGGSDVPEDKKYKRPVLYNYKDLEKNFPKTPDMKEGDYFPNWEDYDEAENLEFIENLAKKGDPVGDSYINDDGTLKTPPKDSVLEKERKILTDAGYKWNKENKQWEKPKTK